MSRLFSVSELIADLQHIQSIAGDTCVLLDNLRWGSCALWGMDEYINYRRVCEYAGMIPDEKMFTGRVYGGRNGGTHGVPVKEFEWRDFRPKAKCLVPPEGWRCTRDAGHDGPCAAVPIEKGR